MTRIQGSFQDQLDQFQLNARFEIPSTGITALFGMSGCGKTTVLRCLAGLMQAKNGFLQVDDEIWQDEKSFLPAHKRPIGYVFQEANLFDHLDVRQNLTFGQKRIKHKTNHGPSLDEVVDLLGISALLDRGPKALSGGERQRVAIGRALLNAPRMLLMDEPLSALDRFSKDEIIPYLERLNGALEIPIVYISHDSDEVERLADHLIVMEKGAVRASGALMDMLTDPDLFLARNSKAASVLKARVVAYNPQDQATELDVEGARLWVSGEVGEIGEARRARIAARDVSLSVNYPSKTTILNVLACKVVSINELVQGRINIVLELTGSNGARLIARITKMSLNALQIEVGQEVYCQIKGISMIERRQK